IELLVREVLLPGREHDGVLAGGMVRVHQDEAVQYLCQWLRVGGGDLRAIRDREHVVSNLASPVVTGRPGCLHISGALLPVCELQERYAALRAYARDNPPRRCERVL